MFGAHNEDTEALRLGWLGFLWSGHPGKPLVREKTQEHLRDMKAFRSHTHHRAPCTCPTFGKCNSTHTLVMVFLVTLLHYKFGFLSVIFMSVLRPLRGLHVSSYLHLWTRISCCFLGAKGESDGQIPRGTDHRVRLWFGGLQTVFPGVQAGLTPKTDKRAVIKNTSHQKWPREN